MAKRIATQLVEELDSYFELSDKEPSELVEIPTSVGKRWHAWARTLRGEAV